MRRVRSLLAPWLLFLPLSMISGSATSAREVIFHRRASQPGDASRQNLDCDLDLTMSIRQSGQVVQQQQQALKRQQQRELTIMKAARDVPQQARVKYHKSVVTLKSAEQDPQSSVQPVTGKTYLVTRDGEKLSIVYADGSQPAEDERMIVHENMETFGLPESIATFFDGKGVRIGQTLNLPTDLARELLGFTATGNTVSEFELTLAQIRPASRAGASPLAVFDISLKAKDPEQTGVSMTLNGKMVMEVETCRTLSVTLAGPVVASEVHGPEGGQYELHSQGQIEVAVRADYQRR